MLTNFEDELNWNSFFQSSLPPFPVHRTGRVQMETTSRLCKKRATSPPRVARSLSGARAPYCVWKGKVLKQLAKMLLICEFPTSLPSRRQTSEKYAQNERERLHKEKMKRSLWLGRVRWVSQNVASAPWLTFSTAKFTGLHKYSCPHTSDVKSSLSSFPERFFIEVISKVHQILTNKFVSLSFSVNNSEFIAT